MHNSILHVCEAWLIISGGVHVHAFKNGMACYVSSLQLSLSLSLSLSHTHTHTHTHTFLPFPPNIHVDMLVTGAITKRRDCG